MNKARSKARTKEWEDPEIRKRRVEGVRKAAFRRYEDQGERNKASARTKALFDDPAYREKHRRAMQKLGKQNRGKPRSAKGLSRSPEYKIWSGMIERCHNPKTVPYKNYGGRGIHVCDEWRGRGGFVRFIEHVGRRPSSELTIGRIDNDGHYEPGNVRWETRVEQMANRRITRHVTIRGETMTLTAWARHIGIAVPTLSRRLRLGWSDDKLLQPGRH
ncbi:hypothetical protein LCGC14_0832250 [marine sediment metagenome]|uniref:Nuclease associated modular domain-containing protein n=1 Tax=marine sediment metagenome TaxID=412755 RepID=A0A0F9S0C4_9ZZZZ